VIIESSDSVSSSIENPKSDFVSLASSACHLSTFAKELILSIAQWLNSIDDINHFALANKHIFEKMEFLPVTFDRLIPNMSPPSNIGTYKKYLLFSGHANKHKNEIMRITSELNKLQEGIYHNQDRIKSIKNDRDVDSYFWCRMACFLTTISSVVFIATGIFCALNVTNSCTAIGYNAAVSLPLIACVAAFLIQANIRICLLKNEIVHNESEIDEKKKELRQPETLLKKLPRPTF
jgi:Transmembrane Fragile-X-F protein